MTPLSAIEQAMNGSMAEQNLISQNIANVDTPNYKAKKIVFDDAFSDALNRTNGSPADYHVVTDTTGSIQNNGNNVSIDNEMSKMAQNQIYYQALSQAASNQFLQFNTVLGGSN
ncbi:flagellar basal body rod protein FlgB [Sporolactobacillus spathodeae]|nr:flagellar basal body rod protein FlgB [Sporolactobacillus spathodeae]